MKRFAFKDNGCPCLDCCAMYAHERWNELARTKGTAAANAFLDDVQRRLRDRRIHG